MGQQDHIGKDLDPATEGACEARTLLLDGLQTGGQSEVYPMGPHILMDHTRHLVVQRGQHLVRQLNGRDVHSGVDQILHHLHAGETAAHHQALAGLDSVRYPLMASQSAMFRSVNTLGSMEPGKSGRMGAAPGESTVCRSVPHRSFRW